MIGLYIASVLLVATLSVAVVVLAARLTNLSRALSSDVLAAQPRPEPLRALNPEALATPKTYATRRAEVDWLIERAQELGEFGPDPRLARACCHSLRGGKRLRPALLMEIARATCSARSATQVDVAEAALFVEYLHTASMVVDDLPEFDDDAERRGSKSLHVEVGPAMAQLAALSLMSAGYQNICRQVDWLRTNCPDIPNADLIGTKLCSCVSTALGASGAAQGQCMDAVLGERELFESHGAGAVEELARLKTATFFEIALLAGWLCAGGDLSRADQLRLAGRHFGTAFQIADDIADAEEDAARRRAGKPGQNVANHRGAAAAAALRDAHLAKARAALEAEGLFTPVWTEVYALVRRTSRVSRPT